uniref:riboflavin kinase n=1 Tax=Elaeophora elaphi TaxID=1147741 RepID=A0A0R3RY10_9BILA
MDQVIACGSDSESELELSQMYSYYGPEYRSFGDRGKIETANKLLGRPYQIFGITAKGAYRRRKIGFPTINIKIEDCTIKPKFGTYYAKAAFSDINSNWLYGVVNIGVRLTFKDLKKPVVEMHIFDFNKDVYDRKISYGELLRPKY